MQIRVHFYSYFKDLAGTSHTVEEMPPGSRIEELLGVLFARFPKLAPMQRSMLMAVGVDYETADRVLKEGDDVSLFPPVQGG